MVSYDTSELRALAGSFRAASELVVPEAHDAITRGAYGIQGRAQTFSPVDTGALRSSISTDVSGLSAEVGPTQSYGIYVETGTSRMAPQPYLGPAFDEVIGSIVDDFANIGGL